MSVDNYLSEKEVKEPELISKLKFVRELELDCNQHKGCFNCNDLHNNKMLQSPSWTLAQHCWACDSVNFVYVADRMGGNWTDIVNVYQSK